MHGPINVKSPNNTSKWQMGFNSAFKGLMCEEYKHMSREMKMSVHIVLVQSIGLHNIQNV
jgi:hypothetical protein